MNEFYSRREQMEQNISDEGIAENAGKFLQEGREVLLSWPEFQGEVSKQFLHKERRDKFGVKFQRGDVWFIVSAGERNLNILWADSEEALKEGGWDKEDRRTERVHSRSMSIFYDAERFRSDKSEAKLFYEGPEIKIPTRNYTMPANTKAVVEQIEKSLAELRKL